MRKVYPAILFSCFMQIVFAQTWTAKQNFGGAARRSAAAFSIGNKGYMGTGYSGAFYKDLWEYDPVSNVWTQKADFMGTARFSSVAFVAGGMGYVGTGYDVNNNFNTKEFYRYDPLTNLWSQVASIPIARRYACAFAIHDKGYVATGFGDAGYLKDLWEYNPLTDAWTKKADFPGHERYEDVAFTVGSLGYVGLGAYGGDLYKDFYEYNADNDTWTQKADCPAAGLNAASGFTIKNKGYIISGSNQQPNGWFNDFWEWDQLTNSWSQLIDFSGAPRAFGTGLSIGGKGYMGLGEAIFYYKDWWEFCPDSCLATAVENPMAEKTLLVSSINQETLSVNSPFKQCVTFKLFDVNGNIVLNTELHDGINTLSLHSFAGGIYFYEVKGYDHQITKGKLVVAKR